jgi:hypothetical protein
MRQTQPLRSLTLEENFSQFLRPYDETAEAEEPAPKGPTDAEKAKEFETRASEMLRKADAFQNEINKFYTELRAANLPFFSFSELVSDQKKASSAVYRVVSVVEKTQKGLKKHEE